jgi:hypothetical protein
MRKKQLSKTEREQILDKLRLYDKPALERMAPIVWHCNWLESRVEELERELSIIRSPMLLDTREQIRPAVGAGDDFAKRWYKLLRGPREDLEKALKWSKRSLEDVTSIAKEYEERLLRDDRFSGGE